MRAGRRKGATSILVISPTRELAAQIAVEAKALSQFHNLTYQVLACAPPPSQAAPLHHTCAQDFDRQSTKSPPPHFSIGMHGLMYKVYQLMTKAVESPSRALCGGLQAPGGATVSAQVPWGVMLLSVRTPLAAGIAPFPCLPCSRACT